MRSDIADFPLPFAEVLDVCQGESGRRKNVTYLRRRHGLRADARQQDQNQVRPKRRSQKKSHQILKQPEGAAHRPRRSEVSHRATFVSQLTDRTLDRFSAEALTSPGSRIGATSFVILELKCLVRWQYGCGYSRIAARRSARVLARLLPRSESIDSSYKPPIRTNQHTYSLSVVLGPYLCCAARRCSGLLAGPRLGPG